VLYRQELQPLVETLSACNCRRRRLCLFVFLLGRQAILARLHPCMRHLLAVYVNRTSVRTSEDEVDEDATARIGRTVTVTKVTESNTGAHQATPAPASLPESAAARTATPNRVLLCDSELFTGMVPVGTRYSTPVLLVAIPTRKLTNATTGPLSLSSSRFDLLCQRANVLANVQYNTYYYCPWIQ
jgi:hypothetical protein